MRKKTVLVFGNPFVEEDSLAFTVARVLRKQLKGISFQEARSMEEIKKHGKKIVAMDVVKGIKKVELITDLDSIHLPPRITTHDFDIGFNLKLLKKLGVLEEVKIIGIPMHYIKHQAVEECRKLLKSI